MGGPIDSHGDFEIHSRASAVSPGDRVFLMFTATYGATAPYRLKIYSPTGANIVDTIVRDLPTTEPQSPPPFEFVVSVGGNYRIEIREMRGRRNGEGTLSVVAAE